MQRIAIGDFAYLWMGNPGARAPSLLISSHGDAIRDMSARAMVAGRWLPPMLHYFSLHGFSVQDPGFENTVTTIDMRTPAEKRISSTVIERIRADMSYDYILYKYQDTQEKIPPFMRNNKNSETYSSIERSIDRNTLKSRSFRVENSIYKFKELYMQTEGYPTLHEFAKSIWEKELGESVNYHLRDVLTIRKRGIVGRGVYLSQVLKALYERGYYYPDILCSFCRGDRVPLSGVGSAV